MKRNYFARIFLLLFLCTACFVSAKTYEWNAFSWTAYGFELILPGLVKGTQDQDYPNPARYFVASDNVNYTISLYSWIDISDNKSTLKDIAQTGFNNYSSIEDKKILEEKPLNRKDGLKYETIYGIGKSRGKSVYFYIAGFALPKNGAAVYSYITFAWWDLPNYNTFHKKLSNEILNKIKILPPPQKVDEGD